MTAEQGTRSHLLGKLVLWREANESELEERAGLPLREYLQAVLALVALTIAVNLFGVEEGLDLPRLMWLVTGGFLLHPFLPVRFRLPYFIGLNVVALLLLFGVLEGLAVFALGMVFIIAASLNISHYYRVALVLLLGAVAAAVKAGVVGGMASYQVATVLGGLFMFRMVLYLYEIRHEQQPVSLWKRISYFFLLPNLVFLIFPIVDYKTFVRGYYSRQAAETVRKGVYWIFTGFLHLLIYRLIYSYAIPTPDDIDGVYSLVQYIVFSYALIIRLSGIFHLSAGIVCLFGFDLPRTFNNYFLASSFSDLWARINVYWRGFVMKVFYYPIFMRFKERNSRAVFITVILVFGVNFFLHSYQWFWIRGKFYFSETDIIFWSVLGLMLAFNSVLALRRKRVPVSASFSWRNASILSLKVMGMFSFMCVMWSLWISQSLETWSLLLRQGLDSSPAEYAVVLAAMGGLVGLGTVLQYLRARPGAVEAASEASAPLSASLVTGIAAGFCVLASPQVTEGIENRWSLNLAPVFSEQLNEHDTELLRKGYYEELIIGNTLSSRMWEVREEEKLDAVTAIEPSLNHVADSVAEKAPIDSDFDEVAEIGAGRDREIFAIKKRMELKVKRNVKRKQSKRDAGLHTESVRYAMKTDDLLMRRLLPNKSLMLDGARFSTNQFGFRDRSYDMEKPPGTYRIAQLGGSPQMGPGVADEEVAENLVEDRLNSEGDWGDYQKVEILNFAQNSYALINQIGVASIRLEQFDPDMILLYLHTVNEERRNRQKFAAAMRDGLVEDFPYLDQLKAKLDIGPHISLEEAIFRLKPYEEELFNWGIEWMVQFCREQEIGLVVVVQDVLNEGYGSKKSNSIKYLDMMKREGILAIDLSDYWHGHDVRELTIARWDNHPNARANRLIAEKIIEGLRVHQAVLVGDGQSFAGG